MASQLPPAAADALSWCGMSSVHFAHRNGMPGCSSAGFNASVHHPLLLHVELAFTAGSSLPSVFVHIHTSGPLHDAPSRGCAPQSTIGISFFSVRSQFAASRDPVSASQRTKRTGRRPERCHECTQGAGALP